MKCREPIEIPDNVYDYTKDVEDSSQAQSPGTA